MAVWMVKDKSFAAKVHRIERSARRGLPPDLKAIEAWRILFYSRMTQPVNRAVLGLPADILVVGTGRLVPRPVTGG
jgi:hypothetical protein